MNSLKNKFFVGLTALAMTAGVYAQSTSPSASPPAGKMNMHGPAGMDHEKMAEKMKAGMAKHLAELHDKLKLTAAQEPAWKTFTESMSPGAMPTHPDRAAMEKMTAPERMEKMLDLAKERHAKMEARLAALKTFYAVLTPEQKKILDASHHRMHRGMRGQQMRHGHNDKEHQH